MFFETISSLWDVRKMDGRNQQVGRQQDWSDPSASATLTAARTPKDTCTHRAHVSMHSSNLRRPTDDEERENRIERQADVLKTRTKHYFFRHTTTVQISEAFG